MSPHKQRRRIGVIGGMGPDGTVLFMSRVLALTPASDDRDHVPLIVDSNTQVPPRISALIDHGENPAPVLCGMARKLEAYGAQALAMPSNAAHAYAAEVRDAVNIPLIDTISLAAEVCGRLSRTARIGILSSPALRIAGVYDACFARAGLVPVWPREEADLLEAVRALKRSRTDAAARTTVQRAVNELAAAGSGAILIAATEFSLIAEQLTSDVPLIDAMDVLAAATVAFSIGKTGA